MLLLSSALAATVEVQPGDDIAALTESLSPGSEVVFGDGVYSIDSTLYWREALGTEDQPIVLRAAEGASPVIELSEGYWVAVLENSTFVEIRGIGFRSFDPASSGQGLAVSDCSDITLVGLDIGPLHGTGVEFGGDNARVSLTDTEIHDIADGTAISAGCWDASCWTSDSVIAHNWIHDIGTEGGNGVYLHHGAQGNTVRDNVIHDVADSGIVTKSTESGPANTVEGNALWAVGDDGVYVEGSVILRNNLVFDVGDDGIQTAGSDERPLSDVVISHNTVGSCGDWGISLERWAGAEGMVLANNAVSNPVGMAFRASEGQIDPAQNRFVGNRFTGLVEGLEEGFAAGNGDGDFLDVEAWNFYPSDRSSLVGAGDADGASWVPETDFNGAPRDGGSPDVGAYERVGDENPGWTVQEGFKNLDPISGQQQEGVGGCGCGEDEGGEEAAALLPLLGLLWRRRRG